MSGSGESGLRPFGYKEGYYEFDADWAYLKFSTGEELPERLTPEELWSNQERLWEFLEHCRTGEADHLLYGSAKNPAVLDITELRFDGEQLWYRRNPAWSGELPYQTDDGEPLSPLTLHETEHRRGTAPGERPGAGTLPPVWL